MRVEIKPLTSDDCEAMADLMRPIDVFEFDVMSGGKPLIDCLDHLFRRSRRARAAYVDGRLVAIYGVLAQTALSTEGNPWLAATDAIKDPRVRRLFVVGTRREAAWLAEGFDCFWNLVSCDNHVTIRWLKWVGFKFDDTSIDVRGHQFVRFSLGV